MGPQAERPRFPGPLLPYVKLIASPGLMHDTGCLGLVHWDDPEGWYGEGGGWGVQDGPPLGRRPGLGLARSMGFSRQEYWRGLLFPSPEDLTDPGIESRSPALWADALTSEPPLYKEFSPAAKDKIKDTAFPPKPIVQRSALTMLHRPLPGQRHFAHGWVGSVGMLACTVERRVGSKPRRQSGFHFPGRGQAALHSCGKRNAESHVG